MAIPQYETFREPFDTGIRISYITSPGGYHPLHWHEELELLYHLNGETDIIIDGKKYKLQKKRLMAIESRQVHSTYTYDRASMFICIHISKYYMEKYFPGLNLYQIHCTPDDITDENLLDYLKLCKMMETITRLYITESPAYAMETEGIILQIFARLIRNFSTSTAPSTAKIDHMSAERIRTIITYVSEHFREPITLDDIAGELGLGKEYFCRFFKKHMGMSFLQYLNEVRASHIYQDLEMTDTPIAELLEDNGFTNQKLFNRVFRQIYGCTPSAVRKAHTAASK